MKHLSVKIVINVQFIGLHRKYPYFYRVLMKPVFATHISEKFWNKNCNKIRTFEAELFREDRETERQTRRS